MKYLHNSPVKFHGNLTSRHCMIDNHWVVSITDWGLNKFKAGQERIDTDTNKTNEGMYVIDVYSLWVRSSEGLRAAWIQVYSVEMQTVSRHWLKERREPKIFLFFTRKLYFTPLCFWFFRCRVEVLQS